MAKKIPKVTDGEMEILQVLWRINLATVKDIHTDICKHRKIGYTTILKQMQLMYAKGLLDRNTDQRQHLYSPIHEAERVKEIAVEKLINNVFDGNAANCIQMQLENADLTMEELDQLKKIVKQKRQDLKQKSQ